MCGEYNGWKNKPTWLVGLWFGNNEDIDSWWVHRAGYLGADGREKLAKEIENSVAGRLDLFPASSLETDMVGWLLAIVDWLAIADGYLDAVDEGDEGDEVPTDYTGTGPPDDSRPDDDSRMTALFEAYPHFKAYFDLGTPGG